MKESVRKKEKCSQHTLSLDVHCRACPINPHFHYPAGQILDCNPDPCFTSKTFFFHGKKLEQWSNMKEKLYISLNDYAMCPTLTFRRHGLNMRSTPTDVVFLGTTF
jgi:hypothetical protein